MKKGVARSMVRHTARYVKIFYKQTKGKTIRRDSKTQVTKTNKGNIFLTKNFSKKKLAKKDVCKTRKQRGDISMLLKTGSRHRKTQQENKREKQKTTKKQLETKLFF